MMAKATKIKSDGRTITVRVPISIRKRGGRKVVLAPDGTLVTTQRLVFQHVDGPMQKAIARSFRWREMLESGKHSTIKEIAKDEEINESYIARVLRLTLLAPDIVASILRGDQPGAITLATLMHPLPVLWADQDTELGFEMLLGRAEPGRARRRCRRLVRCRASITPPRKTL